MSGYRISQLAARSGVPATTLRFYETAGLLPAERTASGYRLYDDAAVSRLEFIGSAKHLGLPLEEIREQAQWRALVAEATGREAIPDGLRLTFPPSPDLAARLAQLAAAEQGCCAFFDFTLHLTPAALEFSVRAPETAATMLADLFGATL